MYFFFPSVDGTSHMQVFFFTTCDILGVIIFPDPMKCTQKSSNDTEAEGGCTVQ